MHRAIVRDDRIGAGRARPRRTLAGSNQHDAVGGGIAQFDGGQQRLYFLVEQIEVDHQQRGRMFRYGIERGQPVAIRPDDLDARAGGQRGAQLLLHDAGPRDDNGWNACGALECSLAHLGYSMLQSILTQECETLRWTGALTPPLHRLLCLEVLHQPVVDVGPASNIAGKLVGNNRFDALYVIH